MRKDHEAILDSLPAQPPRSRLDPYADLIEEMRRRNWTYRGIAQVLAEKCNLKVAPSNIHHFVRQHELRTRSQRQIGAQPSRNCCRTDSIVFRSGTASRLALRRNCSGRRGSRSAYRRAETTARATKQDHKSIRIRSRGAAAAQEMTTGPGRLPTRVSHCRPGRALRREEIISTPAGRARRRFAIGCRGFASAKSAASSTCSRLRLG